MRAIRLLAFLCVAMCAAVAHAQLRATAPLPTPRYHHGAVLLADGRALFAGGIVTFPTILSSTVRYDPALDAWSAGASMAASRSDFPLARLASGKVLAVGGHNPYVDSVDASAELYDPIADAWGPAGLLATPRGFHTATALADGRALVAGGDGPSFSVLASVEIYSPATNSWATVAPMTEAREGHSATLLANGKVLVAGGQNVAHIPLASAEIYDPASDSWTPTGPLPAVLGDNSAAALADGRVVVMGSAIFTDTPPAVLVYTPATNVWEALPAPPIPRGQAAVTAVTGCGVLAAGGYFPFTSRSVGDVDVYDSDTNSWSTIAVLPAGRSLTTALRLANGDALIAGGIESVPPSLPRLLAETYRYTPPASLGCAPSALAINVPVGGAGWLLVLSIGIALSALLRRTR
jgi:hypothetical protein